MIFKRKIYDKLLEWKNLSVGGSAAFLEGARRIGKSTIVEEFAKNEYDDYMILEMCIRDSLIPVIADVVFRVERCYLIIRIQNKKIRVKRMSVRMNK